MLIMNLQEIKESVNLIDYARKYHGLECDKQGKARCPLLSHGGPDKTPSLFINFKDNVWMWNCLKCKVGGTIVDFETKFAGCNEKEAIATLLSRFKDGQPDSPAIPIIPPSPAATVTVVETIPYIYKDAAGVEILKKEKKILSDGKKTFVWSHQVDNSWRFTKGDYSFVPYNLDKFKDHSQVIIAEGEKDSDTINNLNIGEFATSAPHGAGSWPDEITPYFKDFKKITFLYDVGTDDIVKKHAETLKEAYPNIEIYIATVPMKEKNEDISNYLETQKDKPTALLDVLSKEVLFQLDEKKVKIFANTLEELMLKEIPEVEYLIDPYVFRGGLTEIGGVKGSHKSFFLANMAFHYASGVSPFLTSTINKPGNVLLIQQEISLGFFIQRLSKMRQSGNFFTENRLHPYTTTSDRLKLTEPKDLDKLRRWIEATEADILELDPFFTFHNAAENMAKDMSKVLDVLSELKAAYNLAVVIAHHFSSKKNPDDPNAPTEAGAWFRGHSSISDAADVLILLHRLAGQRENPNLPKDYQDYNIVEIALRNARTPKRFTIELNEDTFFLEPSTIWEDMGKLILPGTIENLIADNGNEMRQTKVIEHFVSNHIAARSTVKRAIQEALNQGLIVQDPLSTRGNPMILRLKT